MENVSTGSCRITLLRPAHAAKLLAGALCLVAGFACAQGYPDRPIRLVVPWPVGGVTDLAGRVMAQRLSDRMATPIIVENKAGAAGTIGAEAVARSPANGYTLLLASAETHAIAPNMRVNLPYQPLKDFVAIAPFAINPFALVANPAFPANTTRELIALARTQPGKFTYSSAGLGSTSQIAMETFKGLAKLDILHVPFQGQAPALTALLGGQTDLQMLPAGSAARMRKAGKVRVLAVSTQTRFFEMPDVPTLKEEGFEAMNFANWFGLLAPANVPPAVVERIAADVAAVLASADTRVMLQKLGLDVYPSMSPPEFEKFLESEMKNWSSILQRLNIHPQ